MKKSYLAVCGSLLVAACGTSAPTVPNLPVADPAVDVRPQQAMNVAGYVDRGPRSPEEWRKLNELQGPSGNQTR